MKKMRIKIVKLLLIIQLITCIININVVCAGSSGDDMMKEWESQSSSWSQMGENKVSSMGISIIDLTKPFGWVLGFVHFVAIAVSSGALLLTLVRIIKSDTPSKSKAKQSLPFNLIILFICVAGIPWVKKIISMI